MMLMDSYLKNLFNFYGSRRGVIFLILILFGVGVFFSSLIPPFQSPDEHAHLKRAYLLSKGRLVMETPSGESTGGYFDTSLSSYIDAYSHIRSSVNNKVTLDIKVNAAAIKWLGVERFGTDPGINYYLPLIYLPQTVGLLIGQWADLTVEQSYYLARYLALLSSIGVILIAFSIARVNVFVVAMLAMPLMVFQMVSTSQDGFAIALLILATSLFIKLTNLNEIKKSKYFYLMATIILLLVTSRINLLPLLILPFAAVALTTKSKYEYAFSVLITCIAIGWIIYALNTTVDNRVAIGASTKEIIIYYLQQPFSFVAVFYETLSNNQLLGFYAASFVGVLGWLDTKIDAHTITIIFCALVVVFVASMSWYAIKTETARRLVLIFVAISSFLLTFFLLLITWTEHPATTVSGVQGRYLWGPVLLLAYGLTVPFYKLSRLRQLVCISGIVVIVGALVFKMPATLVERYHTNNSYLKKQPIKQSFEEISYSIVKNDIDAAVTPGGFVDSVIVSEEEVVLTGWGFFSTEQKQFFSNFDGEISIKYKTKLRQDVANAYKDDSLQYSGFVLIFDKENTKNFTELCLYTKDTVFGVKQLIPGNPDMLYKCANK